MCQSNQCFLFFWEKTCFAKCWGHVFCAGAQTKDWLHRVSLVLDLEIWQSRCSGNILLMEEILHHLLHTKPYETWDILHISWCRISSINSIFCNSDPFPECNHGKWRLRGCDPIRKMGWKHSRISLRRFLRNFLLMNRWDSNPWKFKRLAPENLPIFPGKYHRN